MERLTETNNCIGFMETYLNVDCKECQYEHTAECEEFKGECAAVAKFKDFIKRMYSKLKELEDLEEQGKLLRLPVCVGDTVHTNYSIQGWYFRTDSRPYKAKVVFIGINGEDNYINVDFGNGHMLQFKFSDIGKTVFLTQEQTELALKEMDGENER